MVLGSQCGKAGRLSLNSLGACVRVFVISHLELGFLCGGISVLIIQVCQAHLDDVPSTIG